MRYGVEEVNGKVRIWPQATPHGYCLMGKASIVLLVPPLPPPPVATVYISKYLTHLEEGHGASLVGAADRLFADQSRVGG